MNARQPETGAENAVAELRVEKAVYGGDGLARTLQGQVRFVPFSLPGEIVSARIDGDDATFSVLDSSPDRVEPRCLHFGVCGGCQYQMASYAEQLRMKEAILRETLERAGVADLPAIKAWPSPQEYGYRNRIRLRVRELDGALRLGYSVRGTRDFLPVRMCPIAADVLWQTAEAALEGALANGDVRDWLLAASELEIACDGEGEKVQVQLLCPSETPRRKHSFDALGRWLQSRGIPLASAGASRLHVASGRPLEELAAFGADGIAYRISGEKFWLRRGSFFQVNRFLVPAMLEMVCGQRGGALAWDLFAGVGFFARQLTRRFAGVTAVEANPVAIAELRRGLKRPGDKTVQETTLAYLRAAVVQRERPDLIVLDPPRAGAGEEASRLLAQLAPPHIVYVSCDPTTLGRDLLVLTSAGYRVAEAHMIDLFPQTYHLETVMVLERDNMSR